MNRFLCCSLLALTFGLQAQEPVTKNNAVSSAVFDIGKPEIKPEAPFDKPDEYAIYNSSAKDYAGFTVGLGINVGVQKTSASGNKEFKNASESAYSTMFGGVAAIGYKVAVHGNFMLGAEAGVDFGSGPKRLKVGGELGGNSAGFQYLQKQHAVSQIINSYFRYLSPYLIPDMNGTSINRNAWSNFLRVNRYLGGAITAGLVSPDEMPGPTISGFISGAYSRLYVGAGNNPAATYLSFIGQETANSVSTIGNGNLMLAMREIRNFIVSNNNDLANTLKSIGEANFQYNNAQVPNSSIAADLGAIDVDDEAAAQLAGLFSGLGGYRFEDIGVANMALFNNDEIRIDNAYTMGFKQNSPTNINNLRVDNYIKTRTTFTASPYVALKMGYFLSELRSYMYIKAGSHYWQDTYLQ